MRQVTFTWRNAALYQESRYTLHLEVHPLEVARDVARALGARTDLFKDVELMYTSTDTKTERF